PAADLLTVFSVAWAGAAAWHVLTSPGGAPDWVGLLLAGTVGLVLLFPGAPRALAALAVATLVSVWEEAPVLGNHWLLAGFVDVTLLVALLAVLGRDRRIDRARVARAFLPGARLCLLAFYVFAGF